MRINKSPHRSKTWMWPILGVALLTLLIARTVWAGLRITSPANGTVVTAGGVLSVTVTVDPGSVYTEVQVVGEDIEFSHVVKAPPYQFTLSLPSDLKGPHKITAVGVIGPDKGDFSDSITIDLEPR